MLAAYAWLLSTWNVALGDRRIAFKFFYLNDFKNLNLIPWKFSVRMDHLLLQLELLWNLNADPGSHSQNAAVEKSSKNKMHAEF